MLRVFSNRGTQGMPFIPTPAPTAGTTTPAPTPIEYLTPMIIVCAIGVGIAVICVIVATIIWCCRCCCKRCCKGDPDPERNFLALRLIMVALCLLVLAAAFMGLYGGLMVSTVLRTTIDDTIFALTTYINAIAQLNQLSSSVGLTLTALQGIATALQTMYSYVQLAQRYMTPVDTIRLSLLYSSMAVGMLAAIGLGLGAMLRRKETLQVSFVSACVAIFVAWISFAINYPLAVLLDDSCVTLQQVLSNYQINLGGTTFLVGCIPNSLLSPLIEDLFRVTLQVANNTRNAEVNINGNNPNNFNPLTINVNLINATYPSPALLNAELRTEINATNLAVASSPCLNTCVVGTTFPGNFTLLQNCSSAAGALATLANCSLIQKVLDDIQLQACNSLIVGVLLTFIGAIFIGSLLIPAGLMGLYVAQKFPNRSAAARTKSRFMVIFVWQFFHCLVCVLGEVNKSTAELVTSILSVAGGVLGFALLIIPMNKLDWKTGSQVALSIFLGLYELGLLGGWIYILYYSASNNYVCTQAVLNANTIVDLTGFFGNPICNQSQYSHTMVTSILAGIACGITFTGGFLGLVFAIKICQGTSLNLADSDFELD